MLSANDSGGQTLLRSSTIEDWRIVCRARKLSFRPLLRDEQQTKQQTRFGEMLEMSVF